MTDNEIIKALECHSKPYLNSCAECPLHNAENCAYKLASEALTLIKRQESENEELSGLYARSLAEREANVKALIDMTIECDAMRSAATSYKLHYESFAERVKSETEHLFSGADVRNIVDKILEEI